MRLKLISDYGAESRVLAGAATGDDIVAAMRAIDWGRFHQVVLEQANGDYMEAGGSLDPADGLSLMYEEHGQQMVIEEAPESVDVLTSVLLAYLAGDSSWRRDHDWS